MATRTRYTLLLPGLILLLAAFLALARGNASAQEDLPPGTSPSPLHPTFPLLDADGNNVLDTGQPVSTMATCGACHDTGFITGHSYHADVGLSDGWFVSAPGQGESGRAWDLGPGWFGKWNPLTYRYLSQPGDERVDLTLSEWIMILGARHAGGGPAEETQLDPAWDWEVSGTVEMNCFLCHLQSPDNDARKQMLASGQFRWASTAALGPGVVTLNRDGYEYQPDAFTPNGDLSPRFATIQDPDNENCGLCHGLVHDDLYEPLVNPSCEPESWTTQTTGQIVSPQKLANSGLNLADKASLNRSWDIHAERALVCTDCHFSLNNPVYYQSQSDSQPAHLIFDPRRLELGEYLKQPLHDFARGQSAQGVSPELKGTMRRCEACHDAGVSHDWLPYAERHFDAVACESCHVPQMYSTAFQSYDWTVLTLSGDPNTACRGLEGDNGPVNSLVTGFEPVLLPRQNVDGNVQLAPYNLITSWFWVYGEGDQTRPVRLQDLEAAWLENGAYLPDILAAFDQNGDGALDDAELVIDDDRKETVIRDRLTALGLENPRIQSEIQPYSIHHTVTTGAWAVRECQACHGESSRVTQAMVLADTVPGGVLPEFVQDTNTLVNGELALAPNGALVYRPVTAESNLYVLGHDRVPWVDSAGLLFFASTVAGVALHGGLRIQSFRKNKSHPHVEIKQVYMYSVYERFWHWVQTATILGLLVTGLVIHKPTMFGFLAFPHAVLVHNVLAAILVINAALSLFYHLVSGEIRQYIPRPYGFFDRAIEQAVFYVRGIFKGEVHPFEKTPQKKLNPLQQAVYFGILNVLLPLQVITGALMWGAQKWPQIAASLGGLPFLAPFHTLIAWLFAAFIVMHVYLTTTGHTPTAAIKAMMLGWDEVETPLEEPDETPAAPDAGAAEASAD